MDLLPDLRVYAGGIRGEATGATPGGRHEGAAAPGGTNCPDMTLLCRGGAIADCGCRVPCDCATRKPAGRGRQRTASGGTWHSIGPLPTPYDSGLVTVASADPAQPLLYLDAPGITGYVVNKMGEHDPIRSYTADDLKVSTDGGHTWQSAPASQTRPRLRTHPGLLGTLADGSVVVGCVPDGGTDPYAPAGQDDDKQVTLYAWKVGDSAWRQLAPTFYLGLNTLVITSTGGKQTLWVTNSVVTPLALPTSTISQRPIYHVPTGDLYHVLRFRLP